MLIALMVNVGVNQSTEAILMTDVVQNVPSAPTVRVTRPVCAISVWILAQEPVESTLVAKSSIIFQHARVYQIMRVIHSQAVASSNVNHLKLPNHVTRHLVALTANAETSMNMRFALVWTVSLGLHLNVDLNVS